ncbi:MAG: restriction endonuclease [Anaerolineaceae bacterium]|nr:restriction endonuclease [Anaerolineaceae bacterium]
MSDNGHIYLQLLSILYQFWPLMFFAGLLGAVKGKKTTLLSAVRYMFFIWCGFALIALILLVTGEMGKPFLIREPLNTIFFIGSGLVFGGLFFFLITKDKRRIRRELNQSNSLADLRALSPDDFEKIIVEVFEQAGLKAKQVGESGDHGIDVVIESKSGQHWVAQCKRYKGKVGEPVIRDFFGAMQHEQAARGFVITTGTFTEHARSWAQGKPIILWDGPKLFALIEEMRQAQSAAAAAEPALENKSENEPPLCPDCRVPMVRRVARRGKYAGTQFYGCPNYPKCSQVKIISETN